MGLDIFYSSGSEPADNIMQMMVAGKPMQSQPRSATMLNAFERLLKGF
jgi:hypothetical protein